MIIRLFLIASAVLVALWLLRGDGRGNRLAITRLSGLALVAGWIVAVCFPDAVTALAQAVGVGRGTDLVVYVSVVAFVVGSMLQRRRVDLLEERIAALVRAQAVEQSRGNVPDRPRLRP